MLGLIIQVKTLQANSPEAARASLTRTQASLAPGPGDQDSLEVTSTSTQSGSSRNLNDQICANDAGDPSSNRALG